MKGKKTYFFGSVPMLAVLFSIFSSCTSIHNFAIEIREPAKITFPPDVSGVVIVNNTATPERGDFGTEFYVNNKEINSPFTIEFDSAIWVPIYVMAEDIDAEKFFSKISVHKEPVRTDKANLEIRQIPKAIRQAIYDATDADAIISVDRCLFKYTQKVNQPVIGYFFEPDYTTVSTKTEVNLTCSAYLREKENPLTTFMLQDSLFFTSLVNNDSIQLYDIIPNIMIEEAAAYIGEKAVPYFVPSWKEVGRNLYTSSYDSRMKEALAYAKSNKWTTAEEIWLQLYNKKSNSKTRACLANNLAVVSEMQDDLDKALDWAQKADALFKENERENKKEINLITSYILSLTERINNDLLLNKQFGY